MKLEPTDRNGVIIVLIMTLLMCSAFLTAQSIRKSHEERVWIEPIGRLGYINSHDTIPDSARFEFDPIIDHSQIPSPKVKDNGQVWLKVQIDTVWDYHRDSIFNVEWYALAEGHVMDSRSGSATQLITFKATKQEVPERPGDYFKVTLVHTFLAPHEKQYYKHIKESRWDVIKDQYAPDGTFYGSWYLYDVPLIFYKQYSSYTIHTL